MRIVKLMLFCVLTIYFFNYLQKLPGKVEPFVIEQLWAFTLCLSCVPLNWLIEWYKWKNSLNNIPHSLEVKDQFQAFASGMVTGFFTPSMLGNFIGRLPFFHRSTYLNVVYLTQYGNLSQFTATMVFGGISVFGLAHYKLPQSLQFLSSTALILIGFVSIVIYFGIDTFVKKNEWIRHRIDVQGQLHLSLTFRMQLFVLSCLRHTVFTLQFMLLLVAFGVEIDWWIIFRIWQIYLVVTLLPSLFFGKILIRDSVAWLMLSPIGFTIHQVFSTTLWIWVLNLVIPAVLFLAIVKFQRKWAV